MDYLTNDTELTAVADAIREKSETTDLLEWPNGFIQAIEDCETGGPELEWLWGNQITNTMSGTIDSTDDAYAGPILNLGVDGVSTQAGTPTPDAPVPILSVDDLALEVHGKNLFDTTKLTTTGVTLNGNKIAVSGSWRDLFTGTTGNNAVVTDMSRVLLLPAGTFRVRCAKTDMTIMLKKVNADGTVTELARSGSTTTTWGVTFTLDLPTFVTLRATGGTITDLQIELGSTATAYEPYQGTTVPDLLPEDTELRSLPDGTKDELRLTYLKPSDREGWAWYSREVVQRVTEYDVSDFTWAFWNESSYPHIFRANPSRRVSGRNNCLCTDYKAMDATDAALLNDKEMLGSASTGYIYFRDDSYDTPSAFKAGVTGKIRFGLKSDYVITTQLDPIELPIMPSENATVWCDGGSAQPTFMLEYIQNANIVISRLEDSIADLATS